MYFKILRVGFAITVLASVCCSDMAESDCMTPDGFNGTCISIRQCDPLLRIIRNTNITQRNLNFLRSSQCGVEGKDPKVCCPNFCITPSSVNGTCVSIYSCPSLTKLLAPPLSNKKIQYVQNSRCPSSHEDTVCCPPDEPTVAAGICAATASLLLVHPGSDCCGVESAIGHVNKGGSRTTIYQYPWMAALEYLERNREGNETKVRATGTLISARYVLTAAQCVTGVTVKSFGPPVSVRLGEYEITNEFEPDCVLTKDGVEECNAGMIRVEIERNIPHPDYMASRMQAVHDIALIKLKQNVPFTDFIRPICLPSADLTLAPPADFIMFVAGWGAPNPKEKYSKVKLQVDLPFVDNDRCESAYLKENQNVSLTSGQLCSGGVAGKDACKGDAGAPLMYRNGKAFEVIGLVSLGTKVCGLQNIPGVYTKVFEYVYWIRNTINTDIALFSNDNITEIP